MMTEQLSKTEFDNLDDEAILALDVENLEIVPDNLEDEEVVEKPETVETTEPEPEAVEDPSTDTNKEVSKTSNVDGEDVKDAPTETTTKEVSEDKELPYSKTVVVNGKPIEIRSKDEEDQLLRKGIQSNLSADHNLKAQTAYETLKRNGLLEGNKLNQLIDLSKGNKEALLAHLKETNIDPLDLDTDTQTPYSPTRYEVDRETMVFTQKLEEINTTEYGRNLLMDVNESWDTHSQNELMKSPQLLDSLSSLKQNGIYDEITKEIGRQRAIGNLKNVPFLEAFDHIGNTLYSQPPATTSGLTAPKPTPIAEVKTVNDVDPSISDTPKSVVSQRVDLPSMNEVSDEEFMRNAEKYINNI